MRNLSRWGLVSLAALSLAACNSEGGKAGDTAAATEPSSKTLAATVGDGELKSLKAVVTNAGLASVLEGKGPYTVFAPVDAAFASAGEFGTEALKAQDAALLRAHIVPGALTRSDIESAIASGGSDGAQMRTMADTLLTFSKDGDAILVSAADGAKARLTGTQSLASNGVVQPVDALLVKAATPAA